MSPSGAEVIRQIKSQIEEVDPSEVNSAAQNGNGNRPVLIDVRESEEWDAGHIPGAKHVPRGYLESRIEGAVPDRSQRVVLYCASGNRSALAAHTLQELLGYENVESMTGGITLWKDRGYDVEVPKSLTKEQRERYSRHLLVPEIGLEGQTKLLDGEGAAARRRRPRLADRALPRGRRRRHARHRRRRRGRPLQPPAPGHPHDRRHRHAEGRLGRARDQRDQPRRERRQVPDAPRRLQHHGDHRGLRRDRRRRRQLPDALPAQRRDGAPATSRSCRPRSSASTASSRSSSPTTGRATAACTPCRRRPSWRPPAAPTACSACCRARWACCRRPRSSS